MNTETRNSKLLLSFTVYCQNNPSQRFWQALRNWACVNFLITSKIAPCYLEEKFSMEIEGAELQDTFYWEGRNK